MNSESAGDRLRNELRKLKYRKHELIPADLKKKSGATELSNIS